MSSELQMVLIALARLEEQRDAAEKAEKLAKEEMDAWRDEVRDELREIKTQTTLTNGNVRALQLWQARMGGIASSFGWWKGAVAATVGGVVASGVTAIVYLALN